MISFSSFHAHTHTPIATLTPPQRPMAANLPKQWLHSSEFEKIGPDVVRHRRTQLVFSTDKRVLNPLVAFPNYKHRLYDVFKNEDWTKGLYGTLRAPAQCNLVECELDRELMSLLESEEISVCAHCHKFCLRASTSRRRLAIEHLSRHYRWSPRCKDSGFVKRHGVMLSGRKSGTEQTYLLLEEEAPEKMESNDKDQETLMLLKSGMRGYSADTAIELSDSQDEFDSLFEETDENAPEGVDVQRADELFGIFSDSLSDIDGDDHDSKGGQALAHLPSSPSLPETMDNDIGSEDNGAIEPITPEQPQPVLSVEGSKVEKFLVFGEEKIDTCFVNSEAGEIEVDRIVEKSTQLAQLLVNTDAVEDEEEADMNDADDEYENNTTVTGMRQTTPIVNWDDAQTMKEFIASQISEQDQHPGAVDPAVESSDTVSGMADGDAAQLQTDTNDTTESASAPKLAASGAQESGADFPRGVELESLDHQTSWAEFIEKNVSQHMQQELKPYLEYVLSKEMRLGKLPDLSTEEDDPMDVDDGTWDNNTGMPSRHTTPQHHYVDFTKAGSSKEFVPAQTPYKPRMSTPPVTLSPLSEEEEEDDQEGEYMEVEDLTVAKSPLDPSHDGQYSFPEEVFNEIKTQIEVMSTTALPPPWNDDPFVEETLKLFFDPSNTAGSTHLSFMSLEFLKDSLESDTEIQGVLKCFLRPSPAEILMSDVDGSFDLGIKLTRVNKSYLCFSMIISIYMDSGPDKMVSGFAERLHSSDLSITQVFQLLIVFRVMMENIYEFTMDQRPPSRKQLKEVVQMCLERLDVPESYATNVLEGYLRQRVSSSS